MSNIYHTGDFNFRGSTHVQQDGWSSIGKFLPPAITRPFVAVETAVTSIPAVVAAPVIWVADKIHKVDKIADSILDITAHTASGVDDMLTGKSHFLVYLGIGVVAMVVLPIVLKKVL